MTSVLGTAPEGFVAAMDTLERMPAASVRELARLQPPRLSPTTGEALRPRRRPSRAG